MKFFIKIKFIFIFLYSDFRLKRIAKDKDYIENPKGNKEIKRLIATYANSVVGLSPYKVEIQGLEKIVGLEKTIIMSNHKSNLDPFAIQSALPFIPGWFAKKSLFKNYFIKHIPVCMKSFPLDRGNQRQTSIQFLKAAREFKAGRNLALFPEGTRSKTEDMLPFKESIFAFTKKLKADILPIKLDYKKYLKNKDGTMNKKFVIKILDIVKYEDTQDLTPQELKNKIFNLINKA